MEIYGIRGPALNWFKSYLKHRKQYTEIQNTRSSLGSVAFGVPQGYVLGPIMNDIVRTSNLLNFLTFC